MQQIRPGFQGEPFLIGVGAAHLIIRVPAKGAVEELMVRLIHFGTITVPPYIHRTALHVSHRIRPYQTGRTETNLPLRVTNLPPPVTKLYGKVVPVSYTHLTLPTNREV